MGDFEEAEAFEALLNLNAAKFKADVWALPHHGANLRLGMMTLNIRILNCVLSNCILDNEQQKLYKNLAERGK